MCEDIYVVSYIDEVIVIIERNWFNFIGVWGQGGCGGGRLVVVVGQREDEGERLVCKGLAGKGGRMGRVGLRLVMTEVMIVVMEVIRGLEGEGGRREEEEENKKSKKKKMICYCYMRLWWGLDVMWELHYQPTNKYLTPFGMSAILLDELQL